MSYKKFAIPLVLASFFQASSYASTSESQAIQNHAQEMENATQPKIEREPINYTVEGIRVVEIVDEKSDKQCEYMEYLGLNHSSDNGYLPMFKLCRKETKLVKEEKELIPFAVHYPTVGLDKQIRMNYLMSAYRASADNPSNQYFQNVIEAVEAGEADLKKCYEENVCNLAPMTN